MDRKMRVASSCVLTALLGGVPLGAMAYEQGDFLFRAGAAAVIPNDDSGEVEPIGGTVEVEDGYSLGLTVVGMVTDQIGIELLAAWPFEHDIEGSGALEAIDDLATIKHLPPTVSLQWYPNLTTTVVQPYFGVGVNYTTFFDEEGGDDLEAVVGDTDVSLDDSWGWSVQMGADWQLTDRVFANTAVWYIDIDTEATLDTTLAGKLTVDVDIDPWVVLLGLGYRF
ncbi:MAG: OmpW family outer membrane protein [Pseudomonadota bacterium]|nr:OmpW family outer membrane protein [Pseudomonadota bacterium]